MNRLKLSGVVKNVDNYVFPNLVGLTDIVKQKERIERLLDSYKHQELPIERVETTVYDDIGRLGITRDVI